MKIHPLFEKYLGSLPKFISSEQREWEVAGKPVVEESTAQADAEDKHSPHQRFPYLGTMMTIGKIIEEKDARIRELEAKLAEVKRGPDYYETADEIRNAALEEAAKEFDCMYIDNAPSKIGADIAAHIRGLKRA